MTVHYDKCKTGKIHPKLMVEVAEMNALTCSHLFTVTEN